MRCKPTNYEALHESEIIATWDDLRPDVIIVSHVVTVKRFQDTSDPDRQAAVLPSGNCAARFPEI
jgi:hypothetical protein